MTMIYTSHIHLTEEEHAVLFEYVRAVADELGLRDWDVRLELYPASEGCAGQMVTIYGRRAASMLLGPEWREYGAEDLRNTIVHELLHVHLDDLANCPTLIEDHLAPPALAVFAKAFEHRLEQAIDALATAISPAFPLPPYDEELARAVKKLQRRKARATGRD